MKFEDWDGMLFSGKYFLAMTYFDDLMINTFTVKSRNTIFSKK